MKTWSHVLAAVGLLVLGYWAFQTASARLHQIQEAQRFAGERQAEPRPADTAPQSQSPTSQSSINADGSYPSAGSTIAMLVIPRLGLSTIVVEGAGERELKLGPGHIRGTPLPGDGGNVGVAGHRDTSFRPLRLIRINDAINLTTREREYQYRVASTEIVGPRDVRVLYPTGHETLTLVTCFPFDFVGAAPQRFIVRADCTNCRRSALEQ